MEKYKRLETLIRILERSPFLSKQGIIDYFENHHDLSLPARTLERDFQSLEIDFHIAVKYDRMQLKM